MNIIDNGINQIDGFGLWFCHLLNGSTYLIFNLIYATNKITGEAAQTSQH